MISYYVKIFMKTITCILNILNLLLKISENAITKAAGYTRRALCAFMQQSIRIRMALLLCGCLIVTVVLIVTMKLVIGSKTAPRFVEPVSEYSAVKPEEAETMSPQTKKTDQKPAVNPSVLNTVPASSAKKEKTGDKIAEFARIVEERKQKALDLLEKGERAARSGQLDSAITLLENARSYASDIPEIVFNLGIAYCRKGEYEKGIKHLESAYIMTADESVLEPIKNAYYMTGIAYAKKKKYAEAEKAFSRVIQLDPNSGQAYFNRAVCRVILKHYDSALIDLNTALENGFESLELYLNKAVSLEKTGKPNDAAALYKKILETHPACASAHYNLATLLEQNFFKKGIYDHTTADAIYHYQRAIELDPQLYQAAYNISRIYSARNEVSSAIAWIKKCIEIKETFREAHLFLAQLYLKKKSYNNALAQIDFMEKKGYNFPQLAQMRQEIYQISGQKKPETKNNAVH